MGTGSSVAYKIEVERKSGSYCLWWWEAEPVVGAAGID